MWSTWLLRASRWSRRPPSLGRVAVVLGVLALCLALAGIERAGLWPDALTPERGARHRLPRP